MPDTPKGPSAGLPGATRYTPLGEGDRRSTFDQAVGEALERGSRPGSGFVPDLELERAIARRERDPQYAEQLEGPDGRDLRWTIGIYGRDRSPAITAGVFDPAKYREEHGL